jgi:putative SOS response-associated peptidase YedK
VAGRKLPWFIRPRGGGLLALAGLWSRWRPPGARRSLFTCCIITTAANELVARVHDRMPAIVRPADYGAWLDPGTPTGELLGMLGPYPAGLLESWAVDPAVNRTSAEGPQLIERVDAA